MPKRIIPIFFIHLLIGHVLVMRLSPLSKKLIPAIAVITFIGVILATPQAPSSQEHIPVNNDVPIAAQLDPATIKSLTNLTQHFTLQEPGQTLQYRGYVQGVGYSSYQFLAQQNQQVQILLDAPDVIEMILYGPQVVPLKNNVDYTIPENGLYDLRVLYKIPIEEQQDKAVTAPVSYRIDFTLLARPEGSAVNGSQSTTQ